MLAAFAMVVWQLLTASGPHIVSWVLLAATLLLALKFVTEWLSIDPQVREPWPVHMDFTGSLCWIAGAVVVQQVAMWWNYLCAPCPHAPHPLDTCPPRDLHGARLGRRSRGVQYLHQGRLSTGRIVGQRHDRGTGECWLRFVGEAAAGTEGEFELN